MDQKVNRFTQGKIIKLTMYNLRKETEKYNATIGVQAQTEKGMETLNLTSSLFLTDKNRIRNNIDEFERLYELIGQILKQKNEIKTEYETLIEE